MFLRGKEKHSEGDQSINGPGDIPVRPSPKHSCWLTVTTFLPEKALKKEEVFIPKPQLWSQKMSKNKHILALLTFCCSWSHCLSLWVLWCLFKSGTLPLTLHNFIKTVSVPKLFRKTPSVWLKFLLGGGGGGGGCGFWRCHHPCPPKKILIIHLDELNHPIPIMCENPLLVILKLKWWFLRGSKCSKMAQLPFEIFSVPTWLRVLTWSGT